MLLFILNILDDNVEEIFVLREEEIEEMQTDKSWKCVDGKKK